MEIKIDYELLTEQMRQVSEGLEEIEEYDKTGIIAEGDSMVSQAKYAELSSKIKTMPEEYKAFINESMAGVKTAAMAYRNIDEQMTGMINPAAGKR